MTTPFVWLPKREQQLLTYLRRFCLGMANTRTAERIALDLSAEHGERWSWRAVMQTKERLVVQHGYEIRGWKGGGGFAPGIFIPTSEEECRMTRGQAGRTLSSHERSNREVRRAVARDQAGQGLIFGIDDRENR